MCIIVSTINHNTESSSFLNLVSEPKKGLIFFFFVILIFLTILLPCGYYSRLPHVIALSFLSVWLYQMLLLFKTNQMLSISAEIELPRASRATQNPCVSHPRASIWFQVDHDQNDKSFYLLTSKNDTSFFPSQTQPSFIKMTCCFYQSLKQSAFSVTRHSSSTLKMTSRFDPVYLPPHRIHCARLCLCATCPVQTPTSRPSANLSLRGDAIIFCIYFVIMLRYDRIFSSYD